MRRDLILAGAALLTLTAVAQFLNAHDRDFKMFYDSGRAWLEGRSIYTAEAPNLNPPTAVMALFGPLAVLPYRGAQILWLVISAVTVAASFRIVARELGWGSDQQCWRFGTFALTYPWWLAWYQGQMVWLLLYPATESWRLYRHGQHVAAGLLFAILIALKPPLALVALLLPWRVWVSAGLVSVFVSLQVMIFGGLDPWLAWWSFRRQVRWLSWIDNVSLWGLATRVQSGTIWRGSLIDLTPGTVVLILMACVGIAVWTLREKQPDRRLARAWLAMCLISPLGWVYYLAIGFGAFAASWVPSRSAWTIYGLMCLTFPVLYPVMVRWTWTVPLLGSVYALATLLALWTWGRPAKPQQ